MTSNFRVKCWQMYMQWLSTPCFCTQYGTLCVHCLLVIECYTCTVICKIQPGETACNCFDAPKLNFQSRRPPDNIICQRLSDHWDHCVLISQLESDWRGTKKESRCETEELGYKLGETETCRIHHCQACLLQMQITSQQV